MAARGRNPLRAYYPRPHSSAMAQELHLPCKKSRPRPQSLSNALIVFAMSCVMSLNCHVFAMSFHVFAMSLPCLCPVFAMTLLCCFVAVACLYHAFAMRFFAMPLAPRDTSAASSVDIDHLGPAARLRRRLLGRGVRLELVPTRQQDRRDVGMDAVHLRCAVHRGAGHARGIEKV